MKGGGEEFCLVYFLPDLSREGSQGIDDIRTGERREDSISTVPLLFARRADLMIDLESLLDIYTILILFFFGCLGTVKRYV